MRINPEAVARASSRHPWRTIGLWVVLIVAMGVATGTLLSGVLNNDIAFTNKPESVRAQDVLDQKFSTGGETADTEYVIVESTTLTVDDAAFRSTVQGVVDALKAKDETLRADGGALLASEPTTYYDLLQQQGAEAAAGLVSEDRTATLIPVPIANDEVDTVDELRGAIADAQSDGFTVQVAGPATLNADFFKIAEEDARKGEAIGLMVALVVLVIVFAALVAALLPLLMGVFAIVVALGLVAVVGQLVEFNLFVTNMISMIGLAVGIDYSLFIVSRYREERKKGFAKLDAIGAAGATANRAVFFSGATVVLALLGMFIIPTTIFRALAAGAIFVTVVSIAASMTMLPAMLSLVGDRVNWPRLAKRSRIDADPDPKGGFWDRLTRSVMTRPVVFLVVSVVILGTLGSFYFQLHRGSSTGVSQFPNDVASKQAFLTLEEKFAGGLTQPARIVITGDVNSAAAKAAIADLRSGIKSLSAFSPRTTVIPSKDGTAIEVDAYFAGDSQNDAAFQGIRDLRSQVVPAAFGGVPGITVLVGGDTAFFTDFLDVADKYQVVVLAFVLALSFLLLTVVFRSIVLPIKAIIMNLLSVGAAYGAVTLVFQKGVGIGLFNKLGFSFHQSEAIEAWLPLFLFSVLFGLSMDYHVFLLTRIREAYDKTGDNTAAVAYGLRTTGSIITGAAIIMVVVFTAFAAGRLGPLQQMGFGLAVAVFLDATIVRSLLVPASMRLLGRLNWYLPKWLEWLPKLNVEGHEPELGVSLPEAPELVEATE